MIYSQSLYRLIILILVWSAFTSKILCQSDFEKILTISQDSARVLTSETDNPKWLALGTYQIGRKFVKSNVDSSIYYIKKAINLANKFDEDEAINRMKKTLTYPLIDGQHMREAEEILIDIKPFFKSFRNGSLYESWLINMGYLMTETGRYDEAIIYFTDAFEMANVDNRYKTINDLLNRIGIVYSHLGLKGRALEYYEKVIYNCEHRGQKYMYSAALANAAAILSTTNQDRAVNYYKKFISLRQHLSSPRMKSSVLNARSCIEEMLGDQQRALTYAESAMILIRSSKKKNSIVSQSLRLASLHSQLGNTKVSDTFIEDAYMLGQTIKNVGNQSKVHTQYADLLSRRGDYQNAYLIKSQLDSLTNSRLLKEAENRIIKLEISEIQRLRNIENQNLKIQLEKKDNERYFLIILSLLLFCIIGMAWMSRWRVKRVNNQLAEKNELISKSLQDKNTLMKEIHHRVKNNLQVVSSMLSLQLRYIEDTAAREVMMESRDRVKSIALLHQRLYQEDILKGVHMPSYVESLLSSLGHSYQVDHLSIDIDHNTADIWIDVDTAMPIGMIINELVTNAIKHAFDTEGGKVNVTLAQSENQLSLTIQDNGKGMKNEKDILQEACFGFKMIKSFLRKLKGDINVIVQDGTKIEMTIHKYTIESHE